MSHKEDKKEIEFLNKIKEEQIKKLVNVGFTREQAEVLLQIIDNKVFSGGLV
jgi:hypothetical protein